MANFTASRDSEHHRTYHLRVPVRSYFWEAVRGESTYGRTTPPAPTVALEIGAIHGIQSFYIHEGYELVIKKANSYSWEEIEAQINAAIEEHNLRNEWAVETKTELETPLDNEAGMDQEYPKGD